MLRAERKRSHRGERDVSGAHGREEVTGKHNHDKLYARMKLSE